jgi:hypothetical protein
MIANYVEWLREGSLDFLQGASGTAINNVLAVDNIPSAN